jgi:hypothetical protein
VPTNHVPEGVTMRFALLVQDRVDNCRIKVAKRGTYADIRATARVLSVRFGVLAFSWAASVPADVPDVAAADCPGSHRRPWPADGSATEVRRPGRVRHAGGSRRVTKP